MRVILWGALGLISVSAFSQTNGRIGFYPLDGNALDMSPTKNHGEMLGAVPTKDRFGRSAHAIYVHEGKVVKIPGAPFANDEFTLMIWASAHVIQPRGQSAAVLMIGDESTRGEGLGMDNAYSGGSGFGWGFGSFVHGFRKVYNGHTRKLPDLDRWYHLVMIKSADSVSFYVNGVLVRSRLQKEKPFFGDPVVCWVGSNYRKQHFNGSVDDLMIFNRPLSRDEVEMYYKDGLKIPASP